MKLGEKQTLTVVKQVDFGVYLAEQPEDETRVLLPAKQVPEGTKLHDKLEVFLYKDSKDRLIATTNEPKLTLGGFAVLKVLQVTKIGAFLDWGLEKDLLLPFREQTRKVRSGEQVLAALYIDKSSRLCATMNVYKYLRTDSPYKKGDHVHGRVYEVSDNFGVFAAVDDQYSGLVPVREASGKFQIGDVMEFRVTGVKPDGKLDLSARERIPEQMEEDAQMILSVLDEFDGVFPFDDHASPDVIRREFGLSKNAFKRAVGHLLKEGKIQIKDRRIYLVK